MSIDLTVSPTPAMTASNDWMQTLLQRLTEMEPIDPVVDDPHALMGALMMQGLTAGSPGDQELVALRFADMVAVQGGRSLGYCGCPRIDYAVGERVRVRAGLRPGFWPQESGACGTVAKQEPDPMMAVFPVSPMQPKGIKVSWDDGTESLMYVTNLEPEGPATAGPESPDLRRREETEKGSSPQEGVSQEGGPDVGVQGADSPSGSEPGEGACDYVCFDFGMEQGSMDTPCDGCGSVRVGLISLVEDAMGPDWRACFGG